MDPPFHPLTDFAGVARLFPLPNLVLFPRAVAPLYIFEPRYVAMLEDALADDQLITMSLLLPGWENDYEGRPPVAPVACIGRIITHARLPDGRFNLLLAGIQRAAVRRELPADRPFREAEVELLQDRHSPGGAACDALRKELLAVIARHLPATPAAREQLEAAAMQKLPLGALADVIAHAAAWPVDFKQQLLEELDVERRATRVLERLREKPAPAFDSPTGVFPPRFSDN